MPAVDPSTYTIGGANSSQISADTDTITFSSATSGGESYIYYDFGVGEIEDFVIQATLNLSGASGLSAYHPFGVSNTVGDVDALQTADDGLGVYMLTAVSNLAWKAMDYENDTESSDTSPYLGGSTDIYITLERSGSTLTVTTRLNSHLDTPEDSESVTCATTAYRYLYLGQSRGAGGGSQSYTLTDITQNITDVVNDYTIQCDTQSYVVTPTETGLKTDRFNAETGAFVVAGQDATLVNQHFLTTVDQSFYVVPREVALVVDPPVLIVETGEFDVASDGAMIGQGTSFITTTQSYVVSGQDVRLSGSTLIIPYIYTGGN